MFNDIKIVILNRLTEIKLLIYQLFGELNTYKSLFVFVLGLFVVPIYVSIIIIIGFIYLCVFLLILFLQFIINKINPYQNHTVVAYNIDKNYISDNIYYIFIVNVFLELPKKYAFLYAYNIIKILKTKNLNKIKFINLFDFIFSIFIRFIISITTNLTILILKINIQFTHIISDIFLNDADDFESYVYNILINFIFKSNFDINILIKNKEILI